MATTETKDLSEHQRLQLQFQLFQESLPKVNDVVYRMLLKEMLPLAIAVDKSLSDDEKEDENDKTEQEHRAAEEKLANLSIGYKGTPSHVLIKEYADSDEERRLRIRTKMMKMGYQIGNQVSELLIFSNNPNLNFRDMDLLSVMKFICRDVWKQLFGKQIDNLKTNHRGTFYLFDYDLKLLEGMALNEDALEKELSVLEPYLDIPCGILQGVLASLGYENNVSCQATFVDVPESKAGGFRSFPKGVSFNVLVNVNPTAGGEKTVDAGAKGAGAQSFPV
ncbi:LAMI_0B02190g1_1 [Lachancea mirantina]|uniref:LAMI_0B02190g1_1 n=1 Tax=Lachancea mirantina TaxID=1230905 RepID=A0A1G4ITS2_9SACH|nr:LAMI_0B02190g1_1 [Lachancea mirantina]